MRAAVYGGASPPGSGPPPTLPYGPMLELLGVDSLFAELTLGIGLAILVGNSIAIVKHRRGEAPDGAEGSFRPARVAFLLVVGVVMTAWGGASIFA